MKAFRDELLEYLFEHPGEMMDISFLAIKYCDIRADGIFDGEGDKTISKLLGLNRVLGELEDMKWINCYPKGGFTAGHTGAGEAGKRKLIFPLGASARMTTLGELEYKKLKKEELETNKANIGSFTGVFIQGSSLSETDFRPEINPVANPPIAPTVDATKQGINTRIGNWLAKNTTAIIVSIVSGLIVAFLAWKFGWLSN